LFDESEQLFGAGRINSVKRKMIKIWGVQEECQKDYGILKIRQISKTLYCNQKILKNPIIGKEVNTMEKPEKVFGVNAGKVWGVLKKGPLSAEVIARETKLGLNDVFGALGWLGREGKIKIMKDARGILYKLTE
jgi:hypothetical protein